MYIYTIYKYPYIYIYINRRPNLSLGPNLIPGPRVSPGPGGTWCNLHRRPSNMSECPLATHLGCNNMSPSMPATPAKYSGASKPTREQVQPYRCSSRSGGRLAEFMLERNEEIIEGMNKLHAGGNHTGQSTPDSPKHCINNHLSSNRVCQCLLSRCWDT